MAQLEAQLSQLESLAASFAAGDPACLLLLEERLDDLLAASKLPEGRGACGGLNAVERLVPLIPKLGAHSPQLKVLWAIEDTQAGRRDETDGENVGGFVLRPLILLLRVLRNLCAGERSNQDAFLEDGLRTIEQLGQALAQTVEYKQAERIEKEPLEIVRAGLQLLGNVSGGGEKHQAAIWALCFPDVFCQLSKCPLEEVQGPLCMLLFRCCRESKRRSEQLCGAERLLHLLLQGAQKQPVQEVSQVANALQEKLAAPPDDKNRTNVHTTSLPTSADSSPAVTASTLSSEASLPASTSTLCPASVAESPALQRSSISPQNAGPSPSQVSSTETVQRTEPAVVPATEEGPSYGGGEWLEYLVEVLCQRHQLLRRLFESLSRAQNKHSRGVGQAELVQDSERLTITAAHVTLLEILMRSLQHGIDSNSTSTVVFPLDQAVFILDLIDSAAKTCAAQQSKPEQFSEPPSLESLPKLHVKSAGLESGSVSSQSKTTGAASNLQLPPTLPTGNPAIDVLGSSLRLLSALFASRDVKQSAATAQEDTVTNFLEARLVPVLLGMLRGLGLPERLRPRQQEVAKDRATSASEVTRSSFQNVPTSSFEDRSKESSPSCSQRPPAEDFSKLPGVYPDQCPYLGYRRDIVAVLASAAHREPRVQKAVRSGGGLLLILQHCVVDDENPYLREWGLFAVRNLCEGNEENQNEFAALEVRGAANTEETEKMGYRVEIDAASGKPKLMNIAGGNRK